MKKMIAMVLVLMILSTTLVFANPSITTVKMTMDGKTIDFATVNLEVNGKSVASDVPAVIHENRTLVPVHIIRNMGIQVDWKDATREVIITTNEKTVAMKIDSPIAVMNGEAKRLPDDVPPKIITYKGNGRTMVPIAFLRELDLIVEWKADTRTVVVEQKIQKPQEPIEDPKPNTPITTQEVKDVTIAYTTGTPEVRIRTGEELDYGDFQLTDPARIVIDFEDTKFNFTNKGKLLSNGTFQMNVESNGIKTIRASQFKLDPLITRIAIELDEIQTYEISYDEKTGDMVIQFENSTAEAFNYRQINQTASRLQIRSDEVTQFHFTVSDYGKVVHVVVSKDDIELSMGTMTINDVLVKSIDIGETGSEDAYHIKINLKDGIGYQAFSPSLGKEFILEFKPSGHSGIPLIVIDPGHGGTDPGGSGNGYIEKHLVLDISHRLNKLLVEGGYRTYMTRETDVAVSLVDRVAVANQLNADLFISVHANATLNNAIHGVENLYYPSEKNPEDFRDNRRLAQTFQTEMVRMLGAHDRKIIPRENLYVIRETNMPAIITEIGYLTNSQEAAKLATEQYKQLVAEALYQSIVKYYQ
ncbi:N-acetylmuramoyl-L-alanine amidase [Natronincola peptidivorans]|uniref:N-acetylmuramoyl-L-alanine amidase n=1 Tax=Natronincola peptidivorans TaxID=426128 RepID=A0A1I0A869_9FIRM|nr:N-acetylmuramoyl-L-alanine amidase family protein [Natronincola peptidivorans]SES90338.1 N-acetylmuramoyl-L-alanine amidase [Natronincola peptidivorans]